MLISQQISLKFSNSFKSKDRILSVMIVASMDLNQWFGSLYQSHRWEILRARYTRVQPYVYNDMERERKREKKREKERERERERRCTHTGILGQVYKIF